MSINNYYELLGIGRDSTVSKINSAFRKHSSEVHPDQNDAPDAEHWMSELNKARDTLLDESSRQNYDFFLDELGPKRGHEAYLNWKKSEFVSPENWMTQTQGTENTRGGTESTHDRRKRRSETHSVTCNLCGKTTSQTKSSIYEDYFYCSECTTTKPCTDCNDPINVPKSRLDDEYLCGLCFENQNAKEGIDWVAAGTAIFSVTLFFAAAGFVGGPNVFDPFYNLHGGLISAILYIVTYLIYLEYKRW